MNGYVSSDQIAESPQGQEAAGRSVAAWLNESMSVYDEHWDFGYPSICVAMDALTCDVAVTEYGYDPGALNWRYSGAMLSDTGDLPYFEWMFFYRLIRLANSLLSSVNSPLDGSDVDALTTTESAVIGQMLAARAFAYLHLSQVYEYKGSVTGPFEGLTVPYIGIETTESEARNNPRMPHDEMYNNVISHDLEIAAKYLEGYKRVDKTEIDQAVVYGLLTRTYLVMEQWDKAAEAASKAIALSSGATMLTEEEWTNPSTGFNTMSTPSWMWAIHITSDDAVVQTGICNWTSFMATEFTGGYCGAQNNYSAKACDARLYAQIPDTDWRKKSWLDPNRNKYNYQLNRNLNSAPDLSNIKFRPGSGDTGNYMVACVTDFPMMRIEEMYLALAEATAMAGNVSEGRSLLENFAKTRDTAYTCQASDAKGVQDECFHHRQIEFWGEGIIMFDYKRLDKPQFRGYPGTNHNVIMRFNSPNGTAPWTTLAIPYDETITNLVLAEQQNPFPINYRGAVWSE